MRRTLETYSNFVFETQIKIWEKTDAQDVSKVLRDIADHYEFDGFCLAIDRQASGHIDQFAKLHDWPEAWIEEYRHLELHKKDPHPHLVNSRRTPYVWNENSFASQSDASFVLDVAAQYGLKAGLILPLRLSSGTHALSLHTSKPTASHDLALAVELNLLAVTVADQYLEIAATRPNPIMEDGELLEALSETQKEVLRWMAVGKTNWEIATILSMRKRTVDYHAASILKKLGVASRMQAVNILSKSQL